MLSRRESLTLWILAGLSYSEGDELGDTASTCAECRRSSKQDIQKTWSPADRLDREEASTMSDFVVERGLSRIYLHSCRGDGLDVPAENPEVKVKLVVDKTVEAVESGIISSNDRPLSAQRAC